MSAREQRHANSEKTLQARPIDCFDIHSREEGRDQLLKKKSPKTLQVFVPSSGTEGE